MLNAVTLQDDRYLPFRTRKQSHLRFFMWTLSGAATAGSTKECLSGPALRRHCVRQTRRPRGDSSQPKKKACVSSSWATFFTRTLGASSRRGRLRCTNKAAPCNACVVYQDLRAPATALLLDKKCHAQDASDPARHTKMTSIDFSKPLRERQ